MSEEQKPPIITIPPKPDPGVIFVYRCLQKSPILDQPTTLRQCLQSELRKGILTRYGKKLLEESNKTNIDKKDER